MKKNMEQSDHDLLIELRTEMQNVRNDIKDLKDNTTVRIQSLEQNKADQKTVEGIQKTINVDLETRLKALEGSRLVYYTSMLIYTAVGVTMIGLIIWHLFQN